MSPKSRKRWWIAAALALILVPIGAFVAFRMAVSALKARVEAAVAPETEMASLQVSWSGLVIEGLRVPAPKGWPSKDAFRAERVRVVPTLRSLLSGDAYEIRSITVTAPYLSALRGPEGTLRILPGVRAGSADAHAPGPPPASIGEITFDDGVLEIYDATVAKPPLRIRLEQIEASIEDVTVPSSTGKSDFELDGVVKGGARDGTAHIAGWIEFATADSSISTRLRDVDLAPLAPYLVHGGEEGVRAGRFDLDLDSEVRSRHLRAPGRLTITGLELEPANDVLGTFMGLQRRALLSSLEEKGKKITVEFTLEGDVANPEFSLNSALSQQVALGIAKSLGLSLEGLVEGVGTIGLEGGEAAGGAVKGIGGLIWDLFGGDSEESEAK
jgi:hypothetical protein